MIDSPISGLLSLLSASGLCWPEPRGCLSTPPITPALLSEASGALGEELDPLKTTRRLPPCAGILQRSCWRVVCPRYSPGRTSRCGGVSVTDHSHSRSWLMASRVDAQVLPRLNLADFLREHLKADRHARRLRAWGLRCLHGARRRRDRSFLPDAGGADAECVGRDDRRAVRQWRDRRSAVGVPRPQRAAMRLLHAGHADGGAGFAARHRCTQIASRSVNIFPAITAAAPAIRPSSMRSRATARARMGAQAMTSVRD